MTKTKHYIDTYTIFYVLMLYIFIVHKNLNISIKHSKTIYKHQQEFIMLMYTHTHIIVYIRINEVYMTLYKICVVAVQFILKKNSIFVLFNGHTQPS